MEKVTVTKFIINPYESVIASIIKDIGSVSVLMLTFYINETYINGNNWLNCILFISFFCCLAKYISIQHITEEEAVDMLQENINKRSKNK